MGTSLHDRALRIFEKNRGAVVFHVASGSAGTQGVLAHTHSLSLFVGSEGFPRYAAAGPSQPSKVEGQTTVYSVYKSNGYLKVAPGAGGVDGAESRDVSGGPVGPLVAARPPRARRQRVAHRLAIWERAA